MESAKQTHCHIRLALFKQILAIISGVWTIRSFNHAKESEKKNIYPFLLTE